MCERINGVFSPLSHTINVIRRHREVTMGNDSEVAATAVVSGYRMLVTDPVWLLNADNGPCLATECW